MNENDIEMYRCCCGNPILPSMWSKGVRRCAECYKRIVKEQVLRAKLYEKKIKKMGEKETICKTCGLVLDKDTIDGFLNECTVCALKGGIAAMEKEISREFARGKNKKLPQ